MMVYQLVSKPIKLKEERGMQDSLISVKGLTKRFDKVIANNKVNFEVKPGEIHALLGENGAGKSTLISMLSGVYTPDEGAIYIEGKEVNFASTKDAINVGIGTIYQHLKVIEPMKGKDNIVLGQEKSLFISYKKIYENAQKVKEKYGIDVDLEKYVYDMTVGERQNLEILKVMNRGAKILILDEPTTVFTPQETKKLFKIMQKMKEQGCAIIFITHKLEEVLAVSDRITILRGGKTITTVDIEDVNDPKKLTDLMMGESLDLDIEYVPCKNEKVRLEVKSLSLDSVEQGKKMLDNVEFSLKQGEVLGIAGIAGCGQKELCEALAGIQHISGGEIILEGENITGLDAKSFHDKGISLNFIPEDRLGMGLVGDMDMVDNLLLREYQNKKGLFVDRKSLEPKATEMVEELEIKTPSIHYPIRYLSGGNIQKILLGRELSLNPKILIMSYPTRGLDVKTCYAIYDIVVREKKKGTSVIFVGEDLDVLLKISDRIMVLNQGCVSGVVNAKETTKDQIGLLMVSSIKKVV